MYFFFIYYCVVLLPMSPVFMCLLSRSHAHRNTTHTHRRSGWFLSCCCCRFLPLIQQRRRCCRSLRVSFAHSCSYFTVCVLKCTYIRTYVHLRANMYMFVGIFIWIFPPPPHSQVITHKTQTGPGLGNDGVRRAGSGPLPICHNGLNSYENI